MFIILLHNPLSTATLRDIAPADINNVNSSFCLENKSKTFINKTGKKHL